MRSNRMRKNAARWKRERELDRYNDRIQNCMRNVLASLKISSPAYGWAIDLGVLLAQTERCERCEGNGSHDRHYGCRCNPHDRMFNLCSEPIKCKKCGGCGRLPKKLSPAVLA